MGEHTTTFRLAVGILIGLLVVATIGQSTIPPLTEPVMPSESGVAGVLGDSLAVWNDDFSDTSKIQTELSYNYVVDTGNGTVSMCDTYPVWSDPSFTRMKPLAITNSGDDVLYDYVVELDVYYDSDMQSDFDDLRFVDENGVALSYWIGDRVEGESAKAWVLLPEIPAADTVTVYMFYGKPSAVDAGDFDMIFSWEDRTDPDVMISFKAPEEGAWDSDVDYGEGRFLVAWEERVGPEDINLPGIPNYERTIYSVIHGRSYNIDGDDPDPDPNLDLDIDISNPNSMSYHAENPSIAYGAGKFFVVWEQNPANDVLSRYNSDILGAFVYPDGTVERLSTPICSHLAGQFDPHVAFDSYYERFIVVWEDSREDSTNYNVYGRIYRPNGNAFSEFCITDELRNQGDPWVCSDSLGHFMVVHDDGVDPVEGPFSLYGRRLQANTGEQIGTKLYLATGNTLTDYIFPSVSYNEETERYLVTWNDADISQDPSDRSSYDGNIWGKVLDADGATVVDNFIIQPGTSYIRTDVVPFFSTMFFVSYDGIVGSHSDIWGKLVSSQGVLLTDELMISDGSSQNVDWNNLATGENRIFATWEDERDSLSDYADAFGNVWTLMQEVGSEDISYTFGYERELITEAVLVSESIDPGSHFVEWYEFDADFVMPAGHIEFDILDEDGTSVIEPNVDPKQDISNITELPIRLRATFTRTVPSDTPVLYNWNVSWYMWNDTEPPITEILFDPALPDGENGWYVSPINITLIATDVDSPPENVTTYYEINQFGVDIYDPELPPVISTEGSNNSIVFWSADNAGNTEEPQHYDRIQLDTIAPTVTILQPPAVVPPGMVQINGSITEYSSGSGLHELVLMVNNEEVLRRNLSGFSEWFDWNFTAEVGESYDIHVMVSDTAGNIGQDRAQVLASDRGIYEAGYVYLFDTDKIGPVSLLKDMNLAVAINYDTLYVLLPAYDANASWVQFVATQRFLGDSFVCIDDNLTDGCTCEFSLPWGMYELSAYVYDADDEELSHTVLVTKILVVLIPS